MTRVVYESQCCKAEAKASGMPDFIGSKEVCTVHFTCLECNKSCDVVWPKNYKRKVRAAPKSEMVEFSLNDDIEMRLTKEGRKIYKEYRRKYRHAPLKKVRGRWFCIQLSEFMNIFGSRMFMGADAVIVGNVIRVPKT